jgi:RecA-family ATPase
MNESPTFYDDLDELPPAVADSIASWRRILATARAENVPDLLRNAASDLFRTREVGKTVWPDCDGIVNQAITDALADMAEAAGIDADAAQLIFAMAQRDDDTPEQINGANVSIIDEPPPATSPEEFGIASAASTVEAPEPATLITPADWPDEAPPAIDWLVAGRIPRGDVTTLHGDGGAGKTDIALQLVANVARRAADWLGHKIQGGKVLFISAEEPEREIRRRIWLHGQRDDYSLELLTDLHLWFPDETTGDTVLAIPDHHGIMRPTPLFLSIKAAIERIEPVLVISDNTAATFGGKQIDRLMARGFNNQWRTVARLPSRPAVLLLDHPSLSGLTSGTGRSGNMDWRNAPRGALYLHDADDKAEADQGIRILETAKNNYGPKGNPIRLRWDDGGLVLEKAPSSLHRLAKDAECDETFLRLLDEHNAQGRALGDRPSVVYAPRVFAALEGNGGFTAHAFARAMERLFKAGKIRLREEGSKSKRRSRIDRAG